METKIKIKILIVIGTFSQLKRGGKNSPARGSMCENDIR